MRTKASFLGSAASWLILFIVLVVAPLYLASVGHQHENRGFWIEFGVGLGFVGLAMMGLQFVLTARYSKIGAPFGIDELLNFHGVAGYFAWIFILGHFIILLAADSQFFEFLDPRVNAPRAVVLTLVIIGITALIATTYWREKFGIIYEWWRASHGILALFVVFSGTVHILQVGFYVSEPWQQVVWVTMSAVAIGMLIHNRVWRPLQMRKRPYNVVVVEEESDSIWSIILEPDGHAGLDFKAGQFAWITLGETPFSMQQHPFTMSSAPEEKRLRFTIKMLGDFTSKVPEISTGTNAFVEGPYGNFTLSESTAIHNYFIVGGIGVTPAMSMLRSLRHRSSPVMITLIYGTPSPELTPFKKELEELSKDVELNVVHVFEDAPEEWDGPRGFIDEDLLRKYIPEDVTNCEYFICGPPQMMDIAEETLAKWGTPVHQIHSERFNIV